MSSLTSETSSCKSSDEVPTYSETPFEGHITSPFISVTAQDPMRPANVLRTLILSDLQADPQKVAHLSQWLTENQLAFTIDLILAIGISQPPSQGCKSNPMAEQGNDAATLSELEQICSRVICVPGLHEPPSSWETRNSRPPRLTHTSVNAITGPVCIAPHLVVVHRRFADGITDRPVRQLPASWKQTLYSKMSPPARFRNPQRESAIVLSSSQLMATNSTSAVIFRKVRSLLSIIRKEPDMDWILAVVPPKMQRVPSSSSVLKKVKRSLDPKSFGDGDFCIATFHRPSVWDPHLEPNGEEEQLDVETAWEIEEIRHYNLSRSASDDGSLED